MGKGILSGSPFQIEHHYPEIRKVNTNPNCGCVYRDDERICHNKKSYDFSEKCCGLTHCAWRKRGIYHANLGNVHKALFPQMNQKAAKTGAYGRSMRYKGTNQTKNISRTPEQCLKAAVRQVYVSRETVNLPKATSVSSNMKNSVQVGTLVILHCKKKSEDFSLRIPAENRTPLQDKCIGKRVGFIFEDSGSAYEIAEVWQ